MSVSAVSTVSMYHTLPPLLSPMPYRTEVSEMVMDALKVAVKVLGSKDEKERRFRKAVSPAKKNKWKAHKMLFVYGAEESSGFGLRWIVGIGSFMFGNISAPLTGYDLSLRRFAVSQLTRVDNELASLGRYTQYNRRDDVANALAEMLLHERKIFSIIKRNAETVLCMRIMLLIAAVLGFIGAVGAIPDLLIGGAIGMFATACVMLLKTGFDSSSYQVRREASEMRRYVDYLLEVRWLTGTTLLTYPTVANRG